MNKSMRRPFSQRVSKRYVLAVTAIVLMANARSVLAQQTVAQSPSQDSVDSHQRGIDTTWSFDETVQPNGGASDVEVEGDLEYVAGLNAQAIRFAAGTSNALVRAPIKGTTLDSDHDFSVRFWIRSTLPSDQRCVVLSTKDLTDNSVNSQKKSGFAFFVSNGTWGWNIGSGNRRISYDRTNGEYFRVNDGRWHQLAMTHDSKQGLIRLYFDGRNLVTYNVKDSSGFEFGNGNPLTIGWNGAREDRPAWELPSIVLGATQLQALVDEFDQIGLPPIETREFQMLVSRPTQLAAAKIERLENLAEDSNSELIDRAKAFDFREIESLSRRLMASKFTVHQSSYYNEVALLFKLYRLENGQIEINRDAAERIASELVLHRPQFDMDDLKVWGRRLSSDEILDSYSTHFPSTVPTLEESRDSLIAGSWNIYHGGLHHSIEREGWDSRQAIIDLLKREEVDVLMMQETYSSGDYIAAELGYYFATTIDWDNMSQGSNISVLSRYPITDVYVPPNSTFMSVGTRVSISKTQQIFVISNWFGMRNFEDVYQFHEQRFDQSDSTPTLFAGDFNAVPHTDGGSSPASEKLLDVGFVDAYRELMPDADAFPGFTHRSNRRIDQLYYLGRDLKCLETDVLSTWPSKFPSDHYLIKSRFRIETTANEDAP